MLVDALGGEPFVRSTVGAAGRAKVTPGAVAATVAALARAGALAAGHPDQAAAWAAGIITAERVDAIARNVGA